MSARVLKSFLIGIGYDTRKLEEGEKRVMSSLEGVKSGSLGISAAIVGAFGAAGASVVSTARSVDQLALSTQNLRTSQNAVYNYGNAIKMMGGEASEAVDALQRFEQIQNEYRLKGQSGPLNDLAMAGVDVSTLYATQTGDEFAQALASMLPSLNEGQRAVAQDALGISDATFRTLAGGIDSLNDSLKNANEITGNVDQLTENSRKLLETTSEFGLIIEGIKNEIAEEFLPSMIGAGKAINSFIKDIRGDISGVIDYAADNASATATLGSSATAAVVGAGASKLGLKVIGGGLQKAGTAGVAVTSGAIGADVLNEWLNENVQGYGAASRGFDSMLEDVLGVDRIMSPMEFLFGSGSSSMTRGTRSVNDSIAPSGIDAYGYKEIAAQNNDDLVKALQAAKLNVASQVSMTVQLDGSAIEAKIIDVTERQAFQALEDFQSTTER